MSSRDLILTPKGLRFRGRLIPCVVGRSGVLRDKREGDGGTPAGTHRIIAALYRPDRVPKPAAWARPIRPRDLWSDDPADPCYNRAVHAPHDFSHERLRRPDRMYDIVLVTDWNLDGRQKGAGSAIFLHRWRRPGVPTEGCIAMSPADLKWLAQRLAPGARLLV